MRGGWNPAATMGLPLLLPQGAVRPEEVDLREYELMLIVPAEADDKVIGGVTDRITQLLGRSGGRITNVDRWGRRRFAFPLDKLTEGFYLVVDLEADPTALKELDRVLSLADEVIRFKVVVKPEKAARAARPPVEEPQPAPEAVPEPTESAPAPAEASDATSEEGPAAPSEAEAEAEEAPAAAEEVESVPSTEAV